MTDSKADRIAVVVPTYNATRFLDALLQSLAAHHDTVGQIVFVDDRSPDGTASNLSKRCGELPMPAEVVCLRRNSGGPGKPIMIGIRRATRKWTAVLEQDDVPAENRFAKHLEAAERFPQAVASFGRVRLVGDSFLGKTIEDGFDNETNLSARLNTDCEFTPIAGTEFARMLFKRNHVLTFSNLAVRTNIAANRSHFRRLYQVSADLNFLFRLTRLGNFVWIDHHLADFHRHPESLFHTRVRQGQIESASIRLKIAESLKIKDQERIQQHYWLLRNRLGEALEQRDFSAAGKIIRLLFSNRFSASQFMRATCGRVLSRQQCDGG